MLNVEMGPAQQKVTEILLTQHPRKANTTVTVTAGNMLSPLSTCPKCSNFDIQLKAQSTLLVTSGSN